MEKDSGQQVFHPCGYLLLGENQKMDAKAGVELLDGVALEKRFPQFHALSPRTNGVLDPAGGLLRPELAIASHCQVALRYGAQIRAQELVTAWETDADGTTVSTAHGQYRAKHLVIAAGAWNGKLIPQLRGKLSVTRLTLGWFTPETPGSFSVERFPIWEHGAFYGFPVLPDFPGCKLAKHWPGAPRRSRHARLPAQRRR